MTDARQAAATQSAARSAAGHRYGYAATAETAILSERG